MDSIVVLTVYTVLKKDFTHYSLGLSISLEL